MNLVARVILLTTVALLTACASVTDSTSPVSARARAVRDCNTQEGCDLTPVIDSITPPESSPYPVPQFVCVWGKNLNLFTGTVVYAGEARSTWTVDGCGLLTFIATVSPTGQVPVYVVTDFGTSNTVYFTRH